MDAKLGSGRDEYIESKNQDEEQDRCQELPDLPFTKGKTSSQPTSTSNSQPEDTNSRYSKPCSLCQKPKDVLIRCQIDDTKKWHFICTGACWTRVSGGVVDGDGSNKWYRYGGMWKNKHETVSAKIKGKAKARNRKKDEDDDQGEVAEVADLESG